MQSKRIKGSGEPRQSQIKKSFQVAKSTSKNLQQVIKSDSKEDLLRKLLNDEWTRWNTLYGFQAMQKISNQLTECDKMKIVKSLLIINRWINFFLSYEFSYIKVENCAKTFRSFTIFKFKFWSCKLQVTDDVQSNCSFSCWSSLNRRKNFNKNHCQFHSCFMIASD